MMIRLVGGRPSDRFNDGAACSSFSQEKGGSARGQRDRGVLLQFEMDATAVKTIASWHKVRLKEY